MGRRAQPKKLSLFYCVHWRCQLSPVTCAKRSRKSREVRGHGESRTMIWCERCEVGRQHAKRKLPETWPDGAPVERSEREPPLVPALALFKKKRPPSAINDVADL